MPVYDTPEPVSLSLELGTTRLRVTASDRTDTAVDVRPTDPDDQSDVQAARKVRVEHTNGTIQITGPKARAFDFSKQSRSVDITLDVPTGSRLAAEVQVGGLDATGRLGECRFKSAVGTVRVERTGPLRVDLGAGGASVREIAGDADVHTGSGDVHLGDVEGGAVVKNSNGNTEIDSAAGDIRVRAANGTITVGRAGAGVDAKTSNGRIRIGEVVRGSVVLGTAMGDLEVGIARGTAAWLEVNTAFGHVDNELDDTARPDESERTVEIRGHTAFGDITIRRS